MSMGLPLNMKDSTQRMGWSCTATCWGVVAPEARSSMRAALSAPPPKTFCPSYSITSHQYIVLSKLEYWIVLTGLQQQLNTGPSCSNIARPCVLPFPSTSQIRTFLSQLAAARYSAAGLKRMAEMLSSGGLFTATSFLRSPSVVLAEAEAAAAAADCWPKKLLMLEGVVVAASLLVGVLVGL